MSQVHILSPHEIPPSSLYAIQAGLRGRGSFCCGGHLLDLFKHYWPDFLFDTGALGIYITQLQNRIDKDDPVSVLFSDYSVFLGSAPALRKTYVKQNFHITLARFRFDLAVPSINELPEAMSVSEAQEFADRLRNFAALLEIPHLRYRFTNAHHADIITSTLRRRADWILENWHRAFQEYETACIRQKETPKSRSAADVKLTLRDGDIDEFKQLMTECAAAFTWVSGKVGQSNKFVGVLGNFSLQALQAEGYSAFCMVHEMAALVPNIIRALNYQEVPLPKLSLDSLQSVLITGSAGYGKSSFCFHHAKADAARLIEKKSTLLPVYVKLHQLASHKLGSFEEEFYVTSELQVLANPANQEAQARIKEIRLYLDGMDEIPKLDRQREIMELALKAQEKDPRIQIIVTGRDYVNGPWLNSMPRIKLSELNDAQIKELVGGLLDNDSAQIAQFYSELNKVPSLKPLMEVPLLATLTVSVFRKRTTLPENRVKLYDIFLDLICGGWDLAKNVPRHTNFGAQGKLTLLTRLAGIVHLNKRRDFTVQEVKMAIRDTNRSFEKAYRELLDEIVQDGALIRSGNIYAFKHLSFQEYLTAKDINEPSGRRQKQILGWYLGGDEWWFQTLSFYIGMIAKPQETEQWILKTAGISRGEYSSSPRVTRLLQVVTETSPGYVFSKRFDKRSH